MGNSEQPQRYAMVMGISLRDAGSLVGLEVVEVGVGLESSVNIH
jgi:hypothetical protein